ncbi:MAG: Glycyl-tRNA synthetase alpha chain, partial [uncultured Sphingomonadaceae bacterium]
AARHPAQLPAPDPDAPRLLERPRLPDPAALRHGNGRGHLSPGDDAPRARPRPLVRRLRPAEPPPDRRPLRREPEPARGLLPVSGHPQAQPARPAGALPGQPRRDRHRHARARHPLRRGRLGVADARRVGPRLGGLVR